MCVIGAGYVGLVTAACCAEMGNTVACVDRDQARIAALRDGRLPFFEPGLADLVGSNHREHRLTFASSLAELQDGVDVYFIAVSTPPTGQGFADLSHVLDAAHQVGGHVARDCVVVEKSTVPVGTSERVRVIVQKEMDRRGVRVELDIVSNPEFLKEGDAVNDFMRPERVILGADSERAIELLRQLYAPFIRNRERLFVMGVRDAEMTKYAANAMLATRISFMNEIAGVCERLGVDVENVRRGIGSDSRIGHSFLYPGCGYGGSCFPKDMKALISLAEYCGVSPDLLRAVEARNETQKRLLFEKISGRFGGGMDNVTIAVWGVSFKPGTEDVRGAPSLVLIADLIEAGARVRVYDPVAMESARRGIGPRGLETGRIHFAAHQYDAVAGADALALVTEWKPFRNPDFEVMRKLMRTPVIFDGRNQYDPRQTAAAGFEYYGIGRNAPREPADRERRRKPRGPSDLFNALRQAAR